MADQKRMANYELLRILAMVMVVILHFLSQSDRLVSLDHPLEGVRILGTLMEFFCLAAVNVYVFFSGYFGVKSSFKPGKAVSLLCQIWFYALLIPIALAASGMPIVAIKGGKLNLYGLVQYLFPIETEHYWFATSYLMLYLLSPVLNTAVRNMSKKQLQITLGGLLLLFCVIKSISPISFVTDRYGYDLSWFICVYLVAAYFGKYGSCFFEKNGWMTYILSCLAGFCIHMVMWFVCQRWDGFAYYFTVPFHYNFIFCLTAAIGLFYGFSKIQIKEGVWARLIRKMGGLSFGIYLLHEHIDLRNLWYGWISGAVNPGKAQGLGAFVWELVCSVVMIFAAGILIDWMRSKLFSVVACRLGRRKPGRKLKELAEAFETVDLK